MVGTAPSIMKTMEVSFFSYEVQDKRRPIVVFSKHRSRFTESKQSLLFRTPAPSLRRGRRKHTCRITGCDYQSFNQRRDRGSEGYQLVLLGCFQRKGWILKCKRVKVAQ